MSKAMTKGKTTAAGKGRKPRGKKATADFHKQTVLFDWALYQFGVSDLEEFRKRFSISPDSVDGLDERTGQHHFFEMMVHAISANNEDQRLPVDRLRSYEQNIVAHTAAINTARLHHQQPAVAWKYHQYLALLFTEMFLDRYFTEPARLREELNEQIARHNEAAEKQNEVTPWPLDEEPRKQLARLAFWCATGSGKTLLMHVNIRQFRHYHKQAYAMGSASGWDKLDQVILVTPNDGLSAQHTLEFTQSGFDVVAVGETGASGVWAEHHAKAIKVISIHKLQDEQGPTTLATEGFEGCNLVLVDEGHRGAGRGEDGKWMGRRDQLSKNGFCIEYSATFKEAIGNDAQMRDRYARSVLFDYAYRSFYRDGYGKDFNILNLEDDKDQRRYLTMALLLFHQQQRVWADGGEAMKPFLVDRPLWVFVGNTVVSGGSGSETNTVSDVVEVLCFFNAFLAEEAESIRLIQSLLEEGFLDHQGRNLLANGLPHLEVAGDLSVVARRLYGQILEHVFHAPSGGALAVQLLSKATGELAVKVGEGEPFGVVNVGEPAAVAVLCEENNIARLEDDQGHDSLFKVINRNDSPVNLLVGSRKFAEGWNSWRVSSLGLMHMGKSEGTQIIQLFGRGVRLRGYGMSLRRSSVLSNAPRPPRNLRLLETLQVFGVKASYMKTFRDWIFSEVPEALDKQVWELPVVENLPKDRKLKTLRLKKEIEGVLVERGSAFRQLGPLVVLRPPTGDPADAWIRSHKTKLNWLPRVIGIAGANRQISTAVGQTVETELQQLTTLHVAMLDIDELLFGLETFKAARGLDRLHADRQSILDLLHAKGWYELLASEQDMRLEVYANRVGWQRMAQQLVNAYAERFYRFVRGRWESPYIEVGEIDASDLLEKNYSIETTEHAKTIQEIEQIGEYVAGLKKAIEKDALATWSEPGGRWRTVPFGGHLYQPLLHVGKNAQIRIIPVALDKHEAQFVSDLAKWCKNEKSPVDVYLLRNQAVTGLGFFQASNFFPDFLMWVIDDERQHLVFVDPKGLHHFDVGDPKIQFAKQDLPQLQQTIDPGAAELMLHAFIISNTPYSTLGWSKDDRSLMSKAEIEELGVLFQVDDNTEYIDLLMRGITYI